MRMRGTVLATSRIFFTAVIAASAVSVAPAAAAPVFTCNSAANVFSVRPDGGLYAYPHEAPETGKVEWGPVKHIGSGWDDARTLAAPNGVFYRMHPTGNLYRYRWNGTGWDTWNGRQFRDVGGGWARYTQAEYRNEVTVDEKGRLYQIDAEGRLRVFTWSGNDATGNFLPGGKTLDAGWSQYNLIVAAGDGVLFARKTNGDLHRFRWDEASDRFTQYGLKVGTDWDVFTRVFSAGGDVLYGTRTNGHLDWYRYHEHTNAWAAPVHIGNGWEDEIDVVADPNGCRITGFPRPTRPVVPQRTDAPNTAVQGTDGLVTFFYVNSASGLTAAKQRNPGDYEVLEYQVIADHHSFTGQPGAGVRADGRLDVLANSHADADYRGRLQPTANGPWGSISAITVHKGWMVSDPVVVAEPSKALAMFAVDANGALWHRSQATPATSDYTAWRPISGNVGLSPDFTVVRNGTAFDVVARATDGSVKTATFSSGSLSAWRTVGSGTTERPAAVAHVNGDLQVFVRTTSGAIATQRESNNAFSQVWEPIGSLTAVGSPAAVLRTSGLIDLAARGTDNLVHQTSQVAPAGGFAEWRVRYAVEATTSPTSLLLANGSPIFTWRAPDGSIQTVFDPNGGVTGQTARQQTG